MESSEGQGTGEAYVLLDVEPGSSDDVVRQVVRVGTGVVAYAAAVWGPWDVIARIKMGDLKDLLRFIDRLRPAAPQIRRTETWLVRHDQPSHEREGQPERLAFVMLRVDPRPGSTEHVLRSLCQRAKAQDKGIQVWHVAGVLGPYDIAATVGYDDDPALKRLVMDNFQTQKGVIDTLTIPSIAGMTHPRTDESVRLVAEALTKTFPNQGP